MKTHYLFGTHACAAALANPRRTIKRVLLTKQAADEFPSLKNPQLVDSKKLENILPPGSVHQGIAIECEPLKQPSLQEWLFSPPRGGVVGGGPFLHSVESSASGQASPHPSPPPAGEGVVILDQVTDPHNVGAMLRSAAAFNIGAVIATDRHAPLETGTMAKSASGGMELVPYIMVGNLVQAIDALKKAGYWVYGMDGEAKQAMHEVKFDPKTAMVMGAEGRGLRRLTAEHCDLLVKLPISPRMESLNVSNAAAIAMYELFRATAG